MKKKFDVTGMTCSACSAHVEKAVSKVEGVKSVSVNLLANSMQVEYDEAICNDSAVCSAVSAAGYGASPSDVAKRQKAEQALPRQDSASLSRLILSAVFMVLLMYVSMGEMIGLPQLPFLSGMENMVSFALAQFILCLPVLYLNRNYFTVGFKRLFKGSPNMDSLIAVGASASLLYGVYTMFRMSYETGHSNLEGAHAFMDNLYFESAAMILTLVTLGKYLEGKSKRRTGDALAKLRKLTPATAIVLRNGEEMVVDSSAVAVGDVMIVKSGMSFAADGVVTSGSCFADESAISGESIPVEKTEGATVIGGTVNVGGYVEVRVTSVGTESVLAKIINLVEEAQGSKAPIARMADKVAGVFVPVVMSIALVTFVVWLIVKGDFEFALGCGICVLVISCPCALGLATPVAITVATGKGAENGILIKNGEALERLSKVKFVVLDKTGTITEGKPKVTDIVTDIDQTEFVSIVASIEKKSEHPLGKAVTEYAENNAVGLCEVDEFDAVPGKGVRAKIGGDSYAVGNAKLMAEEGVDEKTLIRMHDLTTEGKTPLLVCKNGEMLGAIAVSDGIKQSSAFAVAELKKLGIVPVMLTGDNEATANAVAKQVGIERVFAGVLPNEKQQKVAELMKEGVTVMVGDGINDAPALTQADIGMAIGSGSDIAVDSADVVLIKDDLADVVTAIRLGKAAVRNIKQNLFWAFFYNALGIPVAAGALYPAFNVLLSPMIGAAAMSLSSVFVVTNALRLKFFKPTKNVSENSEAKGENMNTSTKLQLKIQGMMCGHCVAHVDGALKSVSGVTSVEVSLENKNAVVCGTALDKQALKDAVAAQGYKVTEVTEL